MTPCAVTTGFFVLGRCGNPSATACGGCGRPVCADHVDARGLCPECSGAQGYADPYGRGWALGNRRDFYQQTSYDYGNPTMFSTYDTYDRSGFDQGDQGDDFDIGGDTDGGDDGGDDSGDWVDS